MYYKILVIYKLTETKIAAHIWFAILCRTVTTDGIVSNQATEVKMTVHIRFAKLCMVVTTDSNISNLVTKVKTYQLPPRPPNLFPLCEEGGTGFLNSTKSGGN